MEESISRGHSSKHPITEQVRTQLLNLTYIKPYEGIDINSMGNGKDVTTDMKLEIAHYMLDKQTRIFEEINTNITKFFDIVETDRSRTEPKAVAKEQIIHQIEYLLDLFQIDNYTLATIGSFEFYDRDPKYELFIKFGKSLEDYHTRLNRTKGILKRQNPSPEIVKSGTMRLLQSMTDLRDELATAITREDLSDTGGQHSKTKKRRNTNTKKRRNKNTKRRRRKSMRLHYSK